MNNIGVVRIYGTLDEAERWYKKALDTSPHPIPFRNLFGVYSERQDAAAAKRVLSRWLEMFLRRSRSSSVGGPARGNR